MPSTAVAAFAASALLAAPLRAQDVTGSLRGQVVTPGGEPAAPAQIVVSGRDLLGTRTVTTDRDGYFQVLALPPGEYSLRVNRLGARPVVIERIVVQMGRATPLGVLTLEPHAVQLEPIRIAASRQWLDPTHTDLGGTLTAADYAALPGERDYKSIIAILPHANESPRGDPVNVAGATGLENMYFIDGVNVTAPLLAETGTSLPYNFVRAVEVKTGGYDAQFGKALGAVVNAVTYSGTNDFEANVFAFGTHSELAARPKAEPTLRETSSVNYDVGARLGGPVVRDRLWYSAAYNPRRERVDREVQGHGVFTDERTAQVFAGKVTWQASQKTTLELSLFGDPSAQQAVRVPLAVPSGYTVLNPDPYLLRLRSGGIVGALRTRTTLGERLLLEVALARSRERSLEEGATQTGRTAAFYRDNVARSVSGGSFASISARARRFGATVRATATLHRHTVVGGAEYEDVGVWKEFSHPGGFTLARLAPSSFVTTFEDTRGDFHNRVPTAYLQDSWSVADRLTLNAGLRWSAQTLTGASGRVAQRFPGEWQPRVGAVWQPGARGRQRLFAFYGRFYQQEPLSLSTFNYADFPFVQSYYSVDPRQSGATPDSVFDNTTYEIDFAKSIPGLKAEHSDEFTVGYERLTGESTKWTARIIRRELRSSFQWGFGPTGFVLGTPGKGDFAFLPGPKREYTALELSVDRGWRELRYRASYVLSRNWGNYTGLYDADLGVFTPGGVRTLMAPHQALNSTGLLPNDRPHVFKLSAFRRPTRGLTAGAVLRWASGSPLNAFAPGPNIGVFRTFLVPRGSAGRTPPIWDLNLRLAHQVRRGRAEPSRIVLDVLHVGNPQRPVWVEELKYLTNTGGAFSNPNPRYGQPIAYQRPMLVRLGLEAAF